MLKFFNINFKNNNNNKAKKIYNNGNIFIVRPQNMKFPYKIISIKEKQNNIEDHIKVLKVTNQKNSFTLSDICSISNFDLRTQILKNKNKENNKKLKNSFLNSNNNNSDSKLNKNNSDTAIRKRIMNLEMKRQMENKKIIQRNYVYNLFLQNKGLSNDRCTHKFSYDSMMHQKQQKVKEENSKQTYYDSTMLNNEKNKNCCRLKYLLPSSGIIMNDVDEKNLIWKRNFENNNTSKIKEKRINLSLKIKRPKSSKISGIKTNDKIVYKLKRPFSTENKNRCKKHHIEIKSYKRNNKIEENKCTKEKESKTQKIRKKIKFKKPLKNKNFNNGNNPTYINELKSGTFNDITKLTRFKMLKSAKNSDIFNYIVLPNSDISSNIKKEINKDFTEYKSIIGK